ncbi:GCN5-related N-acetyltransferase [Thermobaculum terrenum ATCC BAA-798]|uniref:GCN5-related N-acetyltransferase n=1 Tax=Thermobaculum terrenum (strain ATCC BAA-798 / CCMEE 7001 / YNP1) TaxID=525904 RepID=D1CF18_THET1|nr:GCN5-related N-acetyltransferase [Thermobaculum terrenum ATCC BAA-798]
MLIRPASTTDLANINTIIQLNEEDTEVQTPDIPSYIQHELKTGEMYVAEDSDGELIGFSAVLNRGQVHYLAELFVHPQKQSQKVGQTLLDVTLKGKTGIKCTVSSEDKRALALYIRQGMQPRWQNFVLRAGREEIKTPLLDVQEQVELVKATRRDPRVLSIDSQVSGRHRVQDLEYLEETGYVPLLVSISGETQGYAYYQIDQSTNRCEIGPIASLNSKLSKDITLSIVNFCLQQTAFKTLSISVPGPHPALRPLLTAGFKIAYVETFLSSEVFFDPQEYIMLVDIL